MAETEEWAQRACLRMEEVTVMHSVVTKATGSTAMGRDEVDMAESGRGSREEKREGVDMLERLGIWNRWFLPCFGLARKAAAHRLHNYGRLCVLVLVICNYTRTAQMPRVMKMVT